MILPLIFVLPIVTGYNYCNNKTHKCVLEKTEHFMCRLDKYTPLENATKLYAIVPDTESLQLNILNILNRFRNHFASGDLRTAKNITFARAKRMRTLLWDNELGYMARVHASTVSYQHTECRATLRFPYVGESLALLVPKQSIEIPEILQKMFNTMFDEYLNVVDPEGLLLGYDPHRDYDCADFTNIISDRVSRVGCGLAVGSNCRSGSSTNFCHFLTCHFDFTNMEGSYVYKAGKPATCVDWNTKGSKKFPNLCDNNGNLFPPDQGDK
ncbi:venom allergen 3-like [Drosophila eugracilis]|uniref:venom allergen 3-like n=1 Tax=Drosophila eugracilis TaxID=29029 RepID=UPI0007E89035|nr:venom allergen 3-like [Drosophila eugracilis]